MTFKKWVKSNSYRFSCADCEDSAEAAYLAGQASVKDELILRDQQIQRLIAENTELDRERDEAVRQWERFERMAGDNWAALKAQAGEPVAWQHRQRGLKEYEWQEWQTVGYKPQGPESQTFQMRPLFTHPIPQAGEPNWIELEKAAAEIVRNKPTYKRFIDGTPLSNDIAVWMADFAMEHGIYQPVEPTTEPIKEQAGEPVAYVDQNYGIMRCGEIGIDLPVGTKLFATHHRAPEWKPIGYARKQDLLEYRPIVAMYSTKLEPENGHECVALYSEDQLLNAAPAKGEV